MRGSYYFAATMDTATLMLSYKVGGTLDVPTYMYAMSTDVGTRYLNNC